MLSYFILWEYLKDFESKQVSRFERLFYFRYANRAKNIKNKPRVNEDPKDALLREFQLEIARLKAQINEKGVGVKKEKKKKKKKLNSNVKPVNQIEKVPI